MADSRSGGGSRGTSRGILGTIEWIGNMLPDPALLFVIGAVLIMIISALVAPRQTEDGIAADSGWVVQTRQSRPKFEFLTGDDGLPLTYDGAPRIRLLTGADGRPEREFTSDARIVEQFFAPAPPEEHGESSEVERDDAVHHAPLVDEQGRPIVVLRGEEMPMPRLQAENLLSSEGLYKAARNLVKNFMDFPPLGVVLTGMLGIGVAERTGLLGAGLKAFVLMVPRFLLTPAFVFLGVMSSMGVDAGYIVLPPLAAALYQSIGRSPLVGIAAVFAGVSAGFNANLFITGLDPMLAEFTTGGARVLDSDYVVAATCNWWFAIASTFVITFTGWAVTAFIVEPFFNRKPADEGGPREIEDASGNEISRHSLASGLGVFGLFVLFLAAAVGPIAAPASPLFLLGGAYGWLAGQVPGLGGLAAYAETAPRADLWICLSAPAAAGVLIFPLFVYALARGGMPREEAAGLGWAAMTQALIIGSVVILSVLPGSPLYGSDTHNPQFARWVQIIVPIIFLSFILPGLAYGVATGIVRGGKDVTKLMSEAIAGMAPIIVLAFFAAQFIKYFEWSNLDKMLAWTGGTFLADAQLSPDFLIVAFIALTIVFNLFIGSMSAKYAIFAPIFVPMFMMVGIAPELTQAAYRIGDSVSNVITPLNSYMVILLVFMQRYVPKAAMGTVISMMMPYTIVFSIVWTLMLTIWMQFGWPLGLEGPLWYDP